MQTTQILQQENHFLREEIHVKNKILEEKDQQVAQQKTVIDQKNAYIIQLEEALKQQRHKLFGSSSEASADQLGLFNEAEAIDAEYDDAQAVDDTVTVASHTRQKKPRVSIPADLPREDIIHDLPEDQKVCPHDGAELTCIGSDDHEQLDIIPAQIKVIRHKRLKYACPCCKQHMVTADKPKQPIEYQGVGYVDI